jgi:hypothetical protein
MVLKLGNQSLIDISSQQLNGFEKNDICRFAPHTLPVYDEMGPGWMYNVLATNWGHWLPDSTQPQIH